MPSVPELSFKDQLLAPGFQRFALPGAALTLMLFFMIQGPVLFKESWGHWETITIIYIMMVMASVLLSPSAFEFPAWRVGVWVLVGLAGGVALFAVVFGGFHYNTGFPLGGAVETIIYQAFVITYAEESFFRGFLTDVGKGRPGIGILGAAALFSVFHLAAYSIAGLNWMAFLVAFFMGIALGFTYLTTRHFASIGLVWGIHLSWNLSLLFF